MNCKGVVQGGFFHQVCLTLVRFVLLNMAYVCMYFKLRCIFVLYVCKRKYKSLNHYKQFKCMRADTMSSYTCDRFQIIHFFLDDCIIVNCVVPLCVFSRLFFIGTHTKKQGEDLADNDGDEDEGILFGDEGGSMSLNSFAILF